MLAQEPERRMWTVRASLSWTGRAGFGYALNTPHIPMNAQWQQAFELMIVGMSVVFVFLILLVLMVLALAAGLQRFAPMPPGTAVADDAERSADGTRQAAAIAVAAHHRRVVSARTRRHDGG